MSQVTINSLLHGQSILLTADSNYGGAITSILWNGTQYVASPSGGTGNNGQQIQSAIHSSVNPQTQSNSECYNPTEAGSFNDKGLSSSTELLAMTGSANVLNTEANIAFWAPPGGTTGYCKSGALNTTVLSGVILNKTVTLGFNASIPQAIEYQVSLQIPSSYTADYARVNAFEFLAWYLQDNGYFPFNTFLQYDPITGTNTNVTAEVDYQGGNGVAQANYPVIVSFGNANYAAGVYCPSVQPLADISYSQFYLNNPVKLGIDANIYNINPANQPIYSLTFYLVIGSLSDVNSGLAALIAAYPPPVPNISYPANDYTFVINVAAPNLFPTNIGGPVASYSISPNLTTNTGLTFNTTTGEISGTPNILSSATYLITPSGPGGAGSAYSVEISVVAAVPFVITNNSNNSISYTFKGIDGTAANVGGVCNANSGTNPAIAVPAGTYEVILSPAGMPVNCDMTFNTGEEADNAPGHTFSPIYVSNSQTNALLVTNP